ncbi:hypothetical protein BH11PSE2_BH11PSE2_12030 [soil metagenome]
MRKFILALAALIASGGLAAAQPAAQPLAPPLGQWWPLMLSDEGAVFVDVPSLRRSTDSFVAVILVVPPGLVQVGGHKAEALRSRYVVDCKAKTTRVTVQAGLAADGRVLVEYTSNDPAEAIAPGSEDDIVADLCSKTPTEPWLDSVAMAVARARGASKPSLFSALPPALTSKSVEFVAALDQTAYFLVPSGTSKAGNLVNALVYEVYEPAENLGGAVMSQGMSRLAIDCVKQRYTPLTWTAYDATGKPLAALGAEQSQAIDLKSATAAIADATCGVAAVKSGPTFSGVAEARAEAITMLAKKP